MTTVEIKRTKGNGLFFASHRWDSKYKYWKLLKVWQTFNGVFYKESVYSE